MLATFSHPCPNKKNKFGEMLGVMLATFGQGVTRKGPVNMLAVEKVQHRGKLIQEKEKSSEMREK